MILPFTEIESMLVLDESNGSFGSLYFFELDVQIRIMKRAEIDMDG